MNATFVSVMPPTAPGDWAMPPLGPVAAGLPLPRINVLEIVLCAAPFGIQPQGQVSCQDCVFLNHTIAAVNAMDYYFTWVNCYTNDASFVTGYNGTLPAAAAYSPGTYNQAFVTAPPAATGIALSSGSAWHNTTGFDVILAIPISFSAGGRATIARGPTPSPPTLGTVSRRAADSDLLEYYVPAQWYVTVTLSAATFAADATAQPV